MAHHRYPEVELDHMFDTPSKTVANRLQAFIFKAGSRHPTGPKFVLMSPGLTRKSRTLDRATPAQEDWVLCQESCGISWPGGSRSDR